MAQIPLVLGIKQIIQLNNKLNPGSGLTEHALRAAINSGALPCIRAGRKILINLDCLNAWLNGEISIKHEELESVNGIRRIKI